MAYESELERCCREIDKGVGAVTDCNSVRT
jgi:hypothetical protein